MKAKDNVSLHDMDPSTDKLIQKMQHDTYPHLSKERVREFQSIHATPDQLARADKTAKKEIDDRLKKYILSNEVVEGKPGGPHMKVAVVGTSGSGKSATGNTLLQEKRFHESTSAISQAADAGPFTSKLLTVVDTSGSWQLPKITNEKDHIKIHVLVINMASPRFTQDDLKNLRAMKDYNNIIASKRCIVLLTHASDALQGKSLYEYVQEIQGDPLYDLIMKDMEGWRVMAINNNCDTKYEADKQHEKIVNILQRTYEKADLNPDTSNNRYLFCGIAVLSFVIVFLVIFFSAWYPHSVPPPTMSTTMGPDMTTGTTAHVTKPITVPTTAMTEKTTDGSTTVTVRTQTQAETTATAQTPSTK